MSRAAHLSSINCTQCGAGLSVLGGGRVLAQVCGYCGAVLDAQDAYKVLTSIGKRDHPASPVRIGMSLKIERVEFTVIGTLGVVERHGHQRWSWAEHQLYSPTHGYGWLSVEDGHVLFTRKLRETPEPSWITTATVERAETRPRARLRGRAYRYYESGVTEIDFMEGEFNWVPQLGERSEYVSLLGPDAMLTYTRTPSEREIELTRALDRKAAIADLGLAEAEVPKPRLHPLMPYRALPHERFMRNALGAFAGLALLLALGFAAAGGARILDQRDLPVQSLPQRLTFEITETAQLAEVEISSDVQNAYALFSAEITGPDGQPVAVGARATQYYSGTEGGERWSEGSRRATFRFRPETTGPHRIEIALEEQEPWQGGRVASAVSVSVRERVPSLFHPLAAAALFALGAVALTARRALHQRLRFAGSDWTDED